MSPLSSIAKKSEPTKQELQNTLLLISQLFQFQQDTVFIYSQTAYHQLFVYPILQLGVPPDITAKAIRFQGNTKECQNFSAVTLLILHMVKCLE